MAAKPKHHSELAPDTRERLLLAAADVFAEKGFGGATVKEIADRAGVNISLISYHFNGKEGIFRTLLERFGRERLQDAETILTPADSVDDVRVKIRLWMLNFLRCHVDHASVCGIMHRENITRNTFMWEVFEGTFLKTFEAVMKFFEGARKKGLLRKELDPMMVTSLLFGAMSNLGKNKDLAKHAFGISIEDEKTRARLVEHNLDILLHGIIPADSKGKS